MSDQQRPPVNEVVLSLGLAPQDALIGPRLPELLGRWFDEFAEIQTVPPYDIPVEQQGFKSPVGNSFPGFEILSTAPRPRYWLTATGNPYLVQIQSDYIALNWRRQATEEYVRYDAVRERFTDLIKTVAANLQRRGGALLPVKAELTYINIIAPNAAWSRPSDAHSLFAFQFPDQESYDSVLFGYSKPLRIDDTWTGRMHVNLQTVYDMISDEPRLSLNLTSRSTPLPSDLAAGLEFLDHAHGATNRTFRKLLTPAARTIWGLDDHHK